MTHDQLFEPQAMTQICEAFFDCVSPHIDSTLKWKDEVNAMSNRAVKVSLVVVMLSLVSISVCPMLISHSIRAQASPSQSLKDNEELKRLHDEDQSDRTPTDVDWAIVSPRDKARLSRVKELYLQNRLQTASDYYHAAMILQHGDAPEDFLLAHEFCVLAIIKGKNDKETRLLAAGSEDRFLMNIGRPQRFGTQFHSKDNGPFLLYTVDSGVTDETRRDMGVHSLAEARAHEVELNKK
jgi:hypothetical protein